MLQRFKKMLAVICVFALALSALPQTVSAAAAPVWAKEYPAFYENSTRNGIFTYTIKNLTVGQTVKWSLTGTGSKYATLAKKSTKATSKKVSNTVTIRTNGEQAAKNKLVNITAKIYDKNGKLKSILTTGNIKIKIKPTAIEVVTTSLPSKLIIGNTYPLSYRVTPANATCTKIWSATYSDGTDASDCITSAGLFTPKKEDTYTITIAANIGSKTHASGSATISVSTTLVDVRQSGIDTLVATYSGDARTLVKKDSFILTNSNGLPELIKDAVFSEDGKEVTITLHSTFRDGETYTLADGITTQTFTAKIGKPVSLQILTQTVTANKLTTLQYAVYDANGFDVTTLYPGTVTLTAQIVNGYILPNTNQVIMTTVTDRGTIFMTYTFLDNTLQLQPLQATGTILCVAAVPSGETNFTLTKTPTAPDYNAANYADNRTAYADEIYYIHFRALDTDKEALPYDSITYTSSDPETLVINNSANGVATATAVKPGTVTVSVNVKYGSQINAHSYPVTITQAPYLTSLRADTPTLITSNKYPAGHKQYINVSAYDQRGQSFELTGEIAQFTDNNAYKPANLVSYDATTNRIEITPNNCVAGSYVYTLTLTAGGKAASLNFTVTVQTPPEAGTSTYQVEIDNPVTNLEPNADTNLATFISDRTVTIRLAEYRGNIFYGYYNIQSVRVSKGGMYYTADLTQAPGTNAVDIPAVDNSTFTPRVELKTIALNNSAYSAADVGIYNVEVWFYPRSTPSSIASKSASFELRNDQAEPVVTVARSVASAPCSTALALAQNCLSVSKGEIVNCVVTASPTPGIAYQLQPGDSINIKSVTVRITTPIANNQILTYDVTVNVGRTLKTP